MNILSNDSTNVKSEEVQSIIERMPTYWSKWVALVLLILVILLFTLSFIIKYPDTVVGEISVTSDKSPVRMVSEISGRINLLKNNRAEIIKGDVISYIENGADYKHILLLDSLLNAIDVNRSDFNVPPDTLLLGDVGSQYNSFVTVYLQYNRFLKSTVYSTMKKNLQNQINSDKKVIRNISNELLLKEKILRNSKEQLLKDSILLAAKGISEQYYQNKYNTHISIEESKLSLLSNRLLKESQIIKSKIEIERITQEENDNRDKIFSDLVIRKNELTNAVNMWKKHYLQISPIKGKLEYLGFWKNNCFIQSGQELFSVIPKRSEILGEVTIPSFGSGKVKEGQTTNIKINNFPSDEYGLLKGEVKSVSRITHKIKSEKGELDGYLVVITLPYGTKTNFGIKLPLDSETKGMAEIITKPKRLIQRLFDNIKSSAEK